MRWDEEAPLCACCGAHPGCVSGVEPGQRVCPECRADLIHALARSQWDERDELTHIEESLAIGELDVKIHLANAAVNRIPEKKLLHSMWEDNDLEGNENAIEHYDWIEDHAPGMFVLIDSGDYIVPECQRDFTPGHEHCETYDAFYALYLVPLSVWNGCKETVLLADQEWRNQRSRCQRAGVNPLSDEATGRETQAQLLARLEQE